MNRDTITAMGVHQGKVVETRIDGAGRSQVWIACPSAVVPTPGQYVLALSENDPEAILPMPLFFQESAEGGFLACPPVPAVWGPGTSLNLRGPLGRGFRLPPTANRIGLATLGDSPARLLPLLYQALRRDAAVTLFGGHPLPALPVSVEAYPLEALPEAVDWADYLAIDLPLPELARLRLQLGLQGFERLTCPTQVLIETLMPCSGMADCGACAVPGRQGWLLACKDGPVFDLDKLDW